MRRGCGGMMENRLAETILARLSDDEIVSVTDDDIVSIGYDDWTESEKIINYHVAPPNREWLESLVRILPEAAKYGIAESGEIAELLESIDPEMLITLRGVYIVSAEDGEEPLCEAAGVGLDRFPDSLDFGDNRCLGCFWRTESAIVVNVTALRKCAKEMCEDPAFFKSQFATEREGLFTTITHEIRHLGLENNPFYNFGDEDPDWLQSEEAVEAWGREAYENWLDRGFCPAP